jgi:tetratricopeptide (TPR) repeat protein
MRTKADLAWIKSILFKIHLNSTSRVGVAKMTAAACILVVLFALGIWAMPGSFLATVLVTLLLLFMPGFLLMHLFWMRQRQVLNQLVLAFSLSVGLWSIPATLLLWWHANLVVMIGVVVGIILFLTVAIFVPLPLGKVPQAAFEPTNSSATTRTRTAISLDWLQLVYWGAFFVTIALVLIVFTNIASPLRGDRLSYLAFLRHFLDTDQFLTKGFRLSETLIVRSVRESMQPWVLLLALIIKLARVDLLEAYVYYIPLLLIPLSFFAFYALSRELFSNQLMALIACLVQTLYYFSDIVANEEGIGYSLFLRIIEDKFLIRFILLPVALWLTLRYLKKRDKSALFSLIITIIALGLVHPMGLVLYGISFGSFLLVRFLFGSWHNKKRELVGVLPVIIIILVMLLVPLWQRQQMASSVTSDEFFGKVEENLNSLRARRLLILGEEPDLYIASPDLIAHPLVILAILLTPLLLKYLRTHLNAQFLFANMAGALLLCYTPFITPLLGKVITPWMIWRLLWLLPISLVITFFLDETMQKLKERSGRISPHWLQLIPLGVILIGTVLLWDEINNGLEHLEEIKSAALTVEERSVLAFLREFGDSGSVIMTPTFQLSNEIPGLVGHSYGITFRSAPPLFPSADEDRTRFYEARFVADTHLDILRKYDIKYVILERETDLAYQFEWLSSMFKPLYANQSYLLYQWQPELATQADMEIIQGNTYLLQGDLAAAEMAYQAALRHEPQHPLAATGLGYLYLDEARVKDALAVYQQAIAAAPDDPWLHLYLAEAYVAQGETAEDPEAYREAVKAYRQAFDLAPDNPQIQDALVQAYLALGDQYFEQNLLSQVIAAYEKAIQLDPDNPQVYWKLAEVYETLGQLDQAVAVYARVVARWPDRGDAHLRLGQAYEARGDVEQAVAEYQRSIDLDPALAGAYTRLGDLYENQDTPQEAIALYRAAARKNPGAAWPHLELGKIYLNQGIAGTGDETN